MAKSFACPSCSCRRAVSQAPILVFRKGKKRPRHEIVGYLVKCFDCTKTYEMTKDGAVQPQVAKPQPVPKPERDPDQERMTAAALRSQGPLVPRERPDY